MEYEKAKNIILEKTKIINTEYVDLDNAYGRVLAENLVSKTNVPSFRRSPLDGYCFIANDTDNATKENPVILDVIEEVPCGEVPTKDIKNGQATKILTGAKLPDSANCVAPFEIVEIEKNKIKIFKKFFDGQNVIFPGEDIKEGTLFAKSGDIIDIGIIGTMSSLNINKILVYKKINIGILSTGSELISNDEPAVDGKIYNSNRYVIQSALSKLNANTKFLGIVKDDLKLLSDSFDEASKNNDIIISTGGVSVGDYDLVKQALVNIGVDIMITGLAMKPGMACCIGVKNDKLFLCLSGNPMSALTALYVVCMPAIKKMTGISNYENQIFKVKLANSFDKITKADRFLRSKIDIIDNELMATLNTGQGNIVIKSMIDCNSFIKIKAGEPASQGSIVEAFFL